MVLNWGDLAPQETLGDVSYCDNSGWRFIPAFSE